MFLQACRADGAEGACEAGGGGPPNRRGELLTGEDAHSLPPAPGEALRPAS